MRILITFFLILLGLRSYSQNDFYTSIDLNYKVYYPIDYNENILKNWPIIFYLHGSGGFYNNIALTENVCCRSNFIIITPITKGDRWEPLFLEHILIDAKNRLRIDDKKVFLTGVSMGGFGVWDWAMRFPDRFTAVAPLCGGGDVEQIWKLRHLPIWIFHGEIDDIVSIESGIILAKELELYSSVFKLTTYAEMGHDISKITYENDSLYIWFLNQERMKQINYKINKELLAEYSGDYKYDNGELIKIFVSNDSLIVNINSYDLYLTPENDSTFYIDNWYSNMGIFNKDGLIIYDDNKKSVLKRKEK